MRDQYGRTIEYMRVSVTDRCNLRCVYCMPENGVPNIPHDEILTFDEISRICSIGVSLGISRVRLTGGEPLVRKNLPELVGMIRRIPGMEQVSLTTNGILLKKNINELVSKGIDSVNVSIDTLDEERYFETTRGGRIAEVMDGVEAALKFPELTVRINCVPLEGQPQEDWIQLAGLAKDREVDVRFIEMMPIGFGKKYAGAGQEKVLETLKTVFGEPKRYSGRIGNGPAVYVQFPGFRGKTGFISAVSHQFCSTCNRVRLTSTGILKPCLQYGGGEDLRKLIRRGAEDSEIRESMEKSIYGKPASHYFGGKTSAAEEERENFETKEMSQIGG